jgi:hypothetical protein
MQHNFHYISAKEEDRLLDVFSEIKDLIVFLHNDDRSILPDELTIEKARRFLRPILRDAYIKKIIYAEMRECYHPTLDSLCE